jgi:hypothetical protein
LSPPPDSLTPAELLRDPPQAQLHLFSADPLFAAAFLASVPFSDLSAVYSLMICAYYISWNETSSHFKAHSSTRRLHLHASTFLVNMKTITPISRK